MVAFDKIMEKLRPKEELVSYPSNNSGISMKPSIIKPEPSNYVEDPYDFDAMNKEVADYTSNLAPEDISKIHYAESTSGKFLKNPIKGSTASGNYQFTDSTRELAENEAKKQGLDTSEVNPLRKDAILMKALTKKYENVLENAKNGPFEPTLENIYLLHKNGIQGGLNALNSPENAISKARFKEVNKLLGRMPENTNNNVKPNSETTPEDLLSILGN